MLVMQIVQNQSLIKKRTQLYKYPWRLQAAQQKPFYKARLCLPRSNLTKELNLGVHASNNKGQTTNWTKLRYLELQWIMIFCR